MCWVWTRVLLDEAGLGDMVARRIVQAHGTALGEYALAAARKVGIERSPFTLVLAGGVLRHPDRLLRDSLVARVREAAPGARPVDSPYEPVVGALLLALETASVRIDAGLLARLAPTLPPPSLYLT